MDQAVHLHGPSRPLAITLACDSTSWTAPRPNEATNWSVLEMR